MRIYTQNLPPQYDPNSGVRFYDIPEGVALDSDTGMPIILNIDAMNWRMVVVTKVEHDDPEPESYWSDGDYG